MISRRTIHRPGGILIAFLAITAQVVALAAPLHAYAHADRHHDTPGHPGAEPRFEDGRACKDGDYHGAACALCQAALFNVCALLPPRDTGAIKTTPCPGPEGSVRAVLAVSHRLVAPRGPPLERSRQPLH